MTKKKVLTPNPFSFKGFVACASELRWMYWWQRFHEAKIQGKQEKGVEQGWTERRRRREREKEEKKFEIKNGLCSWVNNELCCGSSDDNSFDDKINKQDQLCHAASGFHFKHLMGKRGKKLLRRLKVINESDKSTDEQSW